MILPKLILTDNSSLRLLFFNRVSDARSILSLFPSLFLFFALPPYEQWIFIFERQPRVNPTEELQLREFRRKIESFSLPIRSA